MSSGNDMGVSIQIVDISLQEAIKLQKRVIDAKKEICPNGKGHAKILPAKMLQNKSVEQQKIASKNEKK